MMITIRCLVLAGSLDIYGSAGSNPGGGQNWVQPTADMYQQSAYYQQTDILQTSDSLQQQQDPGDPILDTYSCQQTDAYSQNVYQPDGSYQQTDTYQQTDAYAQDTVYQPDGSYEQTDTYQQVDQYQQVDASGQVQDYQQVDTYTSDTTYDPNGNIVDQTTTADEVETYSQAGGDTYDTGNDMGNADCNDPGDVTGGAGDIGDTSYDPGDSSCYDGGDGGFDCGDMGGACDLSIDFNVEPRRGNGNNGNNKAVTAIKAVGLAARLAEIVFNFC